MMCQNNCIVNFLIVLVTCGVLKDAYSLQCYECTSISTDPEPNYCGEGFDKTSVTINDCRRSIYAVDPSNIIKEFACISLNETDLITGISAYTRRCAIKNLNDTCQKLKENNQNANRNLKTSCKECQTDFCNSSVAIHSHVISFVFVAFVFVRY